MEHELSDERGDAGFSWVVREPMARASHALAADGKVWLVDPVDWPEAIDRAAALGRPAAVLQLLDRHNRDCATVAARLDVPHLVVPREIPDAPFTVVPLVDGRFWREVALWWEAERTLVVPEAVGTNAFYTGGGAPAGVHLFLRLTPPRRRLSSFEPRHLLVGHGTGLHGDDATTALHTALDRSRRDLPRVVVRLPFANRTP